MSKFYESPEFAEFIRNHVIPGNGCNVYRLIDDGSVSEYLSPREFCPAERGHVVFSVQRRPDIKTVDGYIGLCRSLEKAELLYFL